ncbi:hypothetical protein [uncultured Cellulomonas sp.]|uniref:hypothetical protein n=1 Tax=uncultured Cellulomonas sp. TaxID=189682 RepID=UPI0028E8EE09|nr:hypothetical protein [uncultured Cellulomonas sp.]
MVGHEELVVADAHLHRARRKLEGSISECGKGGAWVEALDRVPSSRQLQQASAGLKRALVYLHAAHEVIGDVADDVAQGATAQVLGDLRLLERQCAMVDELSGHVARQLAMTTLGDSTLDERGRGLAIVQNRIDEARSSAQSAGRLASALAARAHLSASDRADAVVQRLTAEQQSCRLARLSEGVLGVPR